MRPRIRSQRITLALTALLAAVACAPPAHAAGDAVSDATGFTPGRICLTPDMPPGLRARAGGEEVTATCGTKGACDNPGTRDGTGRLSISLRAVVHIFTSSDNTCTLTDNRVRAVIAEMNQDYRDAGAGIQIDLANIRRHEDDRFAVLPNCDADGCVEARRLIFLSRELYAEAPERQLNLYFSCQDFSAFGGFEGAAAFPWYASPPDPSMGMWLNSQALVAHLATHELGHVLGLLHTHRGVSEVSGCDAGCAERVNDPDRDVRGDFCSDTPPTPENFSCNNAGEWDCLGVPWGNTQPDNYMGYGPPGCVDRFTTQQVQRMQCWTQSALSTWYSTPSATCRRTGDGATTALWHFDETSGGALVDDEGGADGALLGTAVRRTSHCGSPCLEFTALADGASLPVSNFGLARGSLSCSFLWNGGGTGWLLDRDRAGAASDLGIELAGDGRLHFHIGGADRVTSARTIEADRWYRVTGSWDGVTARLEIDDIADASAATPATPSAGAGTLYVGSAGLGAPSAAGFAGRVDEVELRSDVVVRPPYPDPDLSPQLNLSAIPTPFRLATSIAFVLPVASRARLHVIDMSGRRVATLAEGDLAAGPHLVDWSGRTDAGDKVPPGMYLLRLATDHGSRTLRLARIP